MGLFYRVAVASFTLGFTYLYLIDATNYINHYYLISILGVLLFISPAGRFFSMDVRLGLVKPVTQVSRIYLDVFKLQIALVYIFAGIAKLESDWILRAMPMKIWLLQQHDFPLLGSLFSQNWVHYTFSWGAAVFDLSIGFLLWMNRTRFVAYLLLLFFHILTGLLFDIGLFPPLMILTTLLFFPPEKFKSLFDKVSSTKNAVIQGYRVSKLGLVFIILFFSVQIVLPIRHHFLYSGNILWTEEGYRWSWRVMLVEKEGFCTFYVEDKDSAQFWEVNNKEFLTGFQIKRMSVRPDFIRQFSHYLAKHYQQKYKLKTQPKVRVDAHLTLNGRMSQRLIDPNVDLASKRASIWQADWILPFKD
ncbi:MAG: HTTM domain-containing protein [Saprospiraceae bacterium]|nr:HTTM domain-containing protein [Saprospiraceae bacterium]